MYCLLPLRCSNQLLQDEIGWKGPIRTCAHVNIAFDEITKRHTIDSRFIGAIHATKGNGGIVQQKTLYLCSVSQTIIQQSVQSLYSATERKQGGGAVCPELESKRNMMMRACAIPVQCQPDRPKKRKRAK